MPETAQITFNFDAPAYAERKDKQERAFEVTTDEWRDAVYEFATEFFLPGRTVPFIFEELSRAYETYAMRRGKPLHDEKRAYAGIQQRLRREKLIEVVPGQSGRSYEGNLRPLYASNVGVSGTEFILNDK